MPMEKIQNIVQIEGTITTLSPLHIGSGKTKGTFHPTLDYLPGRTIRGMIGYYLYKNQDTIRFCETDKSLFEATGINEQADRTKMNILFRNAYPEKDRELFGSTVCSPLCLQWCKKCDHIVNRNKGFCTNKDRNITCHHEGKKRGGFISCSSFDAAEFSAESTSKTIITKCPILRKSHTSPGKEDNITPYHIEGISEGQTFGFRMLVGEQFVDLIKGVLDEASVYGGIGGFRSRGYGSVRFDLEDKPVCVTDLVKNRTEEIRSQIKDNTTGIFTLVANAPMILRNKDGKKSIVGFDQSFLEKGNECLDYVHNLTGELYGSISYAPKQSVSLGRDIARGWSLEKNNTVDEIIPCIGAGSTVNVIANPQAIAALEMFGIGEMTHCGYGQVYCLSPEVSPQ